MTGFLRVFTSAAAIGCCFTIGCTPRQAENAPSAFTEVDSLTEVYLDLQDSILMTWNLMTNDDNQKIKGLYALLHELRVVGQVDPQQLASLEARVHQLKQIRYTSKTVSNAQLVDEYDFASNSLVAEVISLAESHSSYSYNTTMQLLVEEIRSAEQRIEKYRDTYDGIVVLYNNFLMTHKDHMQDIDPNNTLEKKPLFQLTHD
jgi:hypothetical protein